MSQTTPRREAVLHLIREERTRQIQQYGLNDDLVLGFGGTVSIPWLLPYSDSDNGRVEAAFRADYEQFKAVHGNPTWMHLIREEVAEMFDAQQPERMAAEAIQVAALCVSLVEHLLATEGDMR
jgi:hypothetical protein